MKKSALLLVASLVLTAGMAQGQVVVRVAPPPPVVERRPPPPDGRYAWVPGYQRWDGHAYHWVGGRWVVPPRPHAIWVEGHWAPRGGGYRWVPGHWRE